MDNPNTTIPRCRVPGKEIKNSWNPCPDCGATAYEECRGIASQTIRVRRILARVEQPEFEAPELDWINSRTGILGEHFAMAARSIQDLIDTGAMIVVREEVVE